MSRQLPSGTVTFLFTDVEGSTMLLNDLGAAGYASALKEHRHVVRDALAAHGGVEVDTQGDAFFVAFSAAPAAATAAREAQQALAIPVRMGIHTGTPLVTTEGYVGVDVHKAARIAAAGHGKQVLVSSATAALLDHDDLLDLGEHRLKDLSAPERIYQLGNGEFPPLKTLYRTNLPIPATAFVGRERELAELGELLERDDVRLLTLIGPGGTGKTRLALQAAAEASGRYPDGVFWVALAPLRDPQLVLEQAAQALGTSESVSDFVGDKRLLLLFDNFEHVIDAAPALSVLLNSCANLNLLVTSRELLQLASEQSYPVLPLERRDGVELFIARANAVKPSFVADDAVGELCARLDNLPLALELAAARARMLSPHQLLERLTQTLDLLKGGRDADPRQRTLRATIEWSYELLSQEEQELFARLAVFAAGCTLDSAETVCDTNLDTLQSLVDKSLVRVRDDQRFWMLETVREYALERLDGGREADELRRRHAEHFLALAESAPGAAESQALSANVADTTDWRERIEPELDNVRTALDWFRRTGDLDRALRIAFVVAWLHLWPRGRLVEAARWFESILEARERIDPARQVDALQSLAHFGTHLPWEARRDLAEESLRIAREIGDKGREEWSLRRLGNIYVERDPREGRRILLECEPLARELPEKARLAWIQQNLGVMALYAGDYEEARRRLEEGHALFEQLGAEWQAVNALDVLAQVDVRLGELDAARDVLRECLPRAARIDAFVTVAGCLVSAAQIASRDETYDVAARLLAAADAIREREGWNADDFEREVLSDIERRAQDRLGTGFDCALNEGRQLGVADAVALALEVARVA